MCFLKLHFATRPDPDVNGNAVARCNNSIKQKYHNDNIQHEERCSIQKQFFL